MKIQRIIYFSVLFIFILPTNFASAKNIVQKFEPRYWWANMQYKHLLIAIKGENIAQSTAQINYTGVIYNKTIFTDDRNLIFIDIEIQNNAQIGQVPIKIYQRGKLRETIFFEIKKREAAKTPQKITMADLIYPIVIDRFANGNYYNDRPNGYYESPNRENISGIHGGDIKGISNHLTYLKGLGITTIELTPIYESNQVFNSFYHDNITNHYQLDQRLGTHNELKKLAKELSNNNFKYIQSLVLHKTSSRHWIFGQKRIYNSIISQSEDIEAKYDISTQTDPHAIPSDITAQISQKISFLAQYLNQDLLLVSEYLIQNSIWWIENMKPDAIKIEDAHLNNKTFLNKFVQNIKTEYPDLEIMNDFNTPYTDELAYIKAIINNNTNTLFYDYPIAQTLNNAFSEFTSSDEGVKKLHQILAKDFNYENTNNHILFIDNKNTSRAYNIGEKDINQLKMLYTYWATTRGIPMLYYGSEILLDGNINRGESHSKKDFPGGWENDNTNGFSSTNLSPLQKDFSEFISQLIKLRTNYPIFYKGKTQHTIPFKGVYAILKTNNTKTILILYNNNTSYSKINAFSCFDEASQFSQAQDLLNLKKFNNLANIIVDPKSALILELNE